MTELFYDRMKNADPEKQKELQEEMNELLKNTGCSGKRYGFEYKDYSKQLKECDKILDRMSCL